MTIDGIARVLADAILLVLLVMMAEEPLLQPPTISGRERVIRTLRFWLRSAVAVGLAVLLAETGKKYDILPGHPDFPSGHATFAAAAATVVVLQRGHIWIWLAAPLVAAISVSLCVIRAHTPVEVAGGVLLGFAVASLVCKRIPFP